MNRLGKAYLILILSVASSSCFQEEVYSEIPEIQFDDISFINSTAIDSLILSFKFTDEDANIGVTENDIIPEHYVYLDANNYIVTENNIDTLTPPIYLAPLYLVNFEPQRVIDNTLFLSFTSSDYPVLLLDTIFYSNNLLDIEFECPGIINQNTELFRDDRIIVYSTRFRNDQLEFFSVNSQVIVNSVPTSPVENFFNFIVKFEEKVGGDFVEMDFGEIFNTDECDVGNYNGRIPVFDPDGKSGTITYIMTSQGNDAIGFVSAFLDKTIRLRFYIYDRAGNKSNEVFTPEFILSDITQ